EGQADGSLAVVRVPVDEDDALPRAELRASVNDGDDERRRHDGRREVIGAVTRGAGRVDVTPTLWEQPFEELGEILLRPGVGFDDRDAGRRVRDEDVAQTVAETVAEAANLVREVDDLGA